MWLILDTLALLSGLLPQLIRTRRGVELVLPLDRCVKWGYEESFLWRGGDENDATEREKLPFKDWKISLSQKHSSPFNHKLEESLKIGQWQNPELWILARNTALHDTCAKAKQILIIMWAEPLSQSLKCLIWIKYNFKPGGLHSCIGICTSIKMRKSRRQKCRQHL